MKAALAQLRLAEQMAKADPPKEPEPPKKAKKVPAEKPTKVRHTCGHERSLIELENEVCTTCLKGNKQTRRKRNGRLPDAGTFHVTYNSRSQRWSGTLTIPTADPDKPHVFYGEYGAVFGLLAALDRQYRRHLEKQAA